MNSKAWFAIAKIVKYAAVATIAATAIMTANSQTERFLFFYPEPVLSVGDAAWKIKKAASQ